MKRAFATAIDAMPRSTFEHGATRTARHRRSRYLETPSCVHMPAPPCRHVSRPASSPRRSRAMRYVNSARQASGVFCASRAERAVMTLYRRPRRKRYLPPIHTLPRRLHFNIAFPRLSCERQSPLLLEMDNSNAKISECPHAAYTKTPAAWRQRK